MSITVKRIYALSFLALGGIILAARLVVRLRAQDPWLLGDWLINYSAGFVRRGLFGTLLLSFPTTLILTSVILALVLIALYWTLFRFIWLFMKSRDFSWESQIVGLGPALLGFQFWGAGAGFRKELLAYAVCAILLFRREEASIRKVSVSVFLAFLIFLLAVFSWEPTVFFLPIILFILNRTPSLVSHGNLARYARYAFALVAAFGLTLSMTFHGNAQVAARICGRALNIGITNTAFCDGAIGAIGWSSQTTLHKVLSSYPTYFWYLPLAIVAVTPVLSTALRNNSLLKLLGLCSPFLSLFFIVNDYGRWISLIAFVLLFSVQASVPIRSNPVMNFENKAWLIPIFTLGFGVPHVVEPHSGWPVLALPGLLLTLIQHLTG